MSGSRMDFDSHGFLAGMQHAGEATRQAVRHEMEVALLDLERHCKERCPVDQGTLMRGIHAETDGIVVTDTEISGSVATSAETADYALVQHEEVLHHTHPTDGVYASKYMEGPLKEMAPRYIEQMQRAVKGVSG